MIYWYEKCMDGYVEYWNIYTSDKDGFDFEIVAISYKEEFAKLIIDLLSKYEVVKNDKYS